MVIYHPKKQKRKWQNLFYKKCPNCGTPLQDNNDYLSCPNPHPEKSNVTCFYIKKSVAIELLMNVEHPANFCLSPHEKLRIEEVIKNYGAA